MICVLDIKDLSSPLAHFDTASDGSLSARVAFHEHSEPGVLKGGQGR